MKYCGLLYIEVTRNEEKFFHHPRGKWLHWVGSGTAGPETNPITMEFALLDRDWYLIGADTEEKSTPKVSWLQNIGKACKIR